MSGSATSNAPSGAPEPRWSAPGMAQAAMHGIALAGGRGLFSGGGHGALISYMTSGLRETPFFTR